MKKTISLILAALFLFSLAACGTVRNEEQSTSTTPIPENTEAPASDAVSNAFPDETEQESTAATAGKILVVYFSWSGNLDKMAHWVADETGGDLMEQNIDIWDFELTEDEMRQIGEKDLGHSEIINHFDPGLVRALNGMKIHE